MRHATPRTSWRARRLAGRGCALGAACLALAGCGREILPQQSLEDLRADVAQLRQEVEQAMGPDSLLQAARAGAQDVVVGVRTQTVREVVKAAGQLYLRDVSLHIRTDAVVTAGDEVRVGLGPLAVSAGRWDLKVTIERIDAMMSADSVVVGVADSTRLSVLVPVGVRDGTGDAIIDFRWDADRAAGVVCGDFALRERFAGYVAPRTYELVGYFELEIDSAGARAIPVMEEEIAVSPSPTDAGWTRVRALLAEQDRLSNCGLALSPANIESRLRDLLAKGFGFKLPTSVLRPIPLPVGLVDEVEVAGRRAGVDVRARRPQLTEDWLWLTAEVSVAPRSEAIASQGAPPGG